MKHSPVTALRFRPGVGNIDSSESQTLLSGNAYGDIQQWNSYNGYVTFYAYIECLEAYIINFQLKAFA
jgi:hypothetical protein